jgi:lipopolysaccharide/colanic/teichoic acid biosynthesis glycosyltransferase
MPLTLEKPSEKQEVYNQLEPLLFREERRFPFWKRAMDIILSLGILFLTLPMFALIPFLIKLTSPGPVLFKQKRAGLCGEEFTMYKFRSMLSNAEQLRSELEVFNMLNGPVFKMKNDPRVTRFGKFIRKTSLDELPQLWNVLKGQMSMVGPRPLPIPEVEKGGLGQMARIRVRPGLTCLWQISGRSNISDFGKWLRLDLEYVNSHSFILDIKILLKTVPVVVSGFGAE